MILGKGMLLPQWCRHNCTWPTVGGGACARGAVGGGRQIASRTIRTRIDLGRRGREDFFAAWRPQWCVPNAWCWTEALVCCYQGGQLLGATSGAMDRMGEGHAIYWVVRESEGRRKLRTAARSPASTMSCGRRTGVGSGNVNRAAHFGGLMTLSASSFRPKGAGSWRSALSMGIMT